MHQTQRLVRCQSPVQRQDCPWPRLRRVQHQYRWQGRPPSWLIGLCRSSSCRFDLKPSWYSFTSLREPYQRLFAGVRSGRCAGHGAVSAPCFEHPELDAVDRDDRGIQQAGGADSPVSGTVLHEALLSECGPHPPRASCPDEADDRTRRGGAESPSRSLLERRYLDRRHFNLRMVHHLVRNPSCSVVLGQEKRRVRSQSPDLRQGSPWPSQGRAQHRPRWPGLLPVESCRCSSCFDRNGSWCSFTRLCEPYRMVSSSVGSGRCWGRGAVWAFQGVRVGRW